MTFQLRRKGARLSQSTQELGVYRASLVKPPVVRASKFALFYRSRTLWNLMYATGFGVLVVWTVKNYLSFFHAILTK